jgi:hypothetical protein
MGSNVSEKYFVIGILRQWAQTLAEVVVVVAMVDSPLEVAGPAEMVVGEGYELEGPLSSSSSYGLEAPRFSFVCYAIDLVTEFQRS